MFIERREETKMPPETNTHTAASDDVIQMKWNTNDEEKKNQIVCWALNDTEKSKTAMKIELKNQISCIDCNISMAHMHGAH